MKFSVPAPLWASVVAVVIAIAPAQGSAAGLSTKEAAKIAAAAKANFVKQLKDPGSAQFRNLFIGVVEEADSKGEWVTKGNVLCGEVNAKNSYGGYTGFRRFVAYPLTSGGHIDQPEDEAGAWAFEEVVWKQSCATKAQDVK